MRALTGSYKEKLAKFWFLRKLLIFDIFIIDWFLLNFFHPINRKYCFLMKNWDDESWLI